MLLTVQIGKAVVAQWIGHWGKGMGEDVDGRGKIIPRAVSLEDPASKAAASLRSMARCCQLKSRPGEPGPGSAPDLVTRKETRTYRVWGIRKAPGSRHALLGLPPTHLFLFGGLLPLSTVSQTCVRVSVTSPIDFIALAFALFDTTGSWYHQDSALSWPCWE